MIEKNKPLRGLTTIKIGGVAKLYFAPRSEEGLLKKLPPLVAENPIFILGGGSNTILGNLKGCLLHTENLKGFKVLRETDGWVEVEVLGGTPLKELLPLCVRENLSGLEGLFGIPAVTIGGAAAMNASAYGYEVGKLVKTLRVLNLSTFEVEEHTAPPFGYRSSPYPERGLIISLTLRLKRVKTPVAETIRKLNALRRKKQPIGEPTAGSTFKNPRGAFAGKLLEEVGLKGYCTEGGLCFSEKHANFMVNRGNATLDDALRLMEEAKNRVLKTFGVELEEEVKLLGII